MDGVPPIMGCDSTGGTSRGSGTSPVFSFPAFEEWLVASGIDVRDGQLSKYLFRSVGAYRLKPYVMALSDDRVPGRLRNVQALFDVLAFDRDVRAELLRAVDAVETHLKAQCIAAFAEHLGEGGLSDPSNFKHLKDHRNALASLRREAARAGRGDSPPVQGGGSGLSTAAALDAASLGTVSRLLGNMRCREALDAVAASFSANKRCLVSWLKAASLARNSFAHFGPYVVRRQIPSVPKPIRGIDHDNAAPLYVLFVVGRLLEGMAATGGARERGDLRRYTSALSSIVGRFVWAYPELAGPLRIPYVFASEYAEPLLPRIAFSRGRPSVRYCVFAA